MSTTSVQRVQRAAATALLALLVLPPAPVRAQESGPLLKVDLVRMMTASGYDRQEVLEIVRANCVAFEPSARDRGDLQRLPNGVAVVAAIDRCSDGTRTSAGFRRGVVRAVPVTPQVRPGDGAPQPVHVEAEPGEASEPEVVAMLPDLAPPTLAPDERAEPDARRGITAESPPRLLNREQVTRRLLDAYRPTERRGGEVVLRIHVAPDGRPDDAQVRTSEGDPALAAAALEVVDAMVFAPAESRGRRVAAWTDLPFRFSAP
jgi:TonB family protein